MSLAFIFKRHILVITYSLCPSIFAEDGLSGELES